MSFIRAELRFKNASLYNAIIETGLSFPDFAKAVGVNYCTINEIINFRRFPGEETMNKICSYLGLSKQQLFLKYLPQYKMKCENTIKWEITENQFKVLSTSSNQKLLTKDFKTDLDRVLDTLSENEAKIIRMIYLEEKDYNTIADELDISRARVGQICGKAILKMKHNSRKNVLREYL